MKTFAMPILTLMFLSGCSFGHYWTKPASTEADFKRDYYRCYQEARHWDGFEASRSRRMCLEARGWAMDGVRLGFSGKWKAMEDTAETPATGSSNAAPRLAGRGSGVIVSKRGDVLTNAHVVETCREVRAGTVPGELGKAETIVSDKSNDLALIRLTSPATFAAHFREAPSIRQGEGVVVAGFPLQSLLAGLNATTGVVSALAGVGNDARFVQISAPVQAGNSGGPVLDTSGNLIGIVVSQLDAVRLVRTTGDLPQNVNFALKGSVARVFLDTNGIEYQTTKSETRLDTADIAESGKRFTVLIECLR